MDSEYRALEHAHQASPDDKALQHRLQLYLDRSGQTGHLLQSIGSRLRKANGKNRRGTLDVHSLRRLLDHLLLGDALWAHITAPGNTPPPGSPRSLRQPRQVERVRRRSYALAIRDQDTIHLAVSHHQGPSYRPSDFFPAHLTPYPHWADLDPQDLSRQHTFAGSPALFTLSHLLVPKVPTFCSGQHQGRQGWTLTNDWGQEEECPQRLHHHHDRKCFLPPLRPDNYEPLPLPDREFVTSRNERTYRNRAEALEASNMTHSELDPVNFYVGEDNQVHHRDVSYDSLTPAARQALDRLVAPGELLDTDEAGEIRSHREPRDSEPGTYRDPGTGHVYATRPPRDPHDDPNAPFTVTRSASPPLWRHAWSLYQKVLLLGRAGPFLHLSLHLARAFARHTPALPSRPIEAPRNPATNTETPV